jgi:prepilin-type N-terminal cleavage/methylation domain-containing protein
MNTDKQKAFTLIEVVLSMAIILILAGALLTGGKYLKTRAEQQLTQSAIEIIGTALEQYYEQTSPKQFPPQVNSQIDLEKALFGNPPSNTVTITGTHPDIADTDPVKAKIAQAFWSSETAFYFLEKVPQSKAILDGLAERMHSNKDLAGTNLKLEIPTTSGKIYDWVRLVDAWGTTLNYEYKIGYSFPVIKSAGPDKQFGTKDDLTSQ